MGFFSWLLAGGTVAGIGYKVVNKYKKDKARREIKVIYNNELSEEFKEIVNKIAKRLKRVTSIEIYNARIYGKVISQSGISDWSFIVDFNDWGYIDGKYIVESDNSDSEIPERFAELVKEEINKLYKEKEVNINDIIKKANEKENEY